MWTVMFWWVDFRDEPELSIASFVSAFAVVVGIVVARNFTKWGIVISAVGAILWVVIYVAGVRIQRSKNSKSEDYQTQHMRNLIVENELSLTIEEKHLLHADPSYLTDAQLNQLVELEDRINSYRFEKTKFTGRNA